VSNGERPTGIKDTVYDLSGVLYHAARGGQVYSEYVQDAEKEGDRELWPASSGRSDPRRPEGKGPARPEVGTRRPR
jgi:hypothetical protein